jgi:hypothetical protein
LGVTPSAWSGSFKALQVGDRSAVVNVSNSTILSSNYFNDGTGDKFILSAGASVYQQIGGDHRWLTTLSTQGIGNPISFTQAMTLDASGNLGVGATSPATYGAKLAVFDGGGNPIVAIAQATSYTTLQSNGQSFYLNMKGTGSIVFRNGSGDTERASIDTSGNLLVGTTNSSNSAGTGIKFSANGLAASVIADSGTAADTWNVYNTTAGAFRFYVTNGGTIFATSTTISAISDERLKENIQDIDTGLNAIMALKPRRFDWKDGKGQDKKNAAGFIAQEFEDVFPECVGTSKAGEDGIEYKNINHETLIPTLVKAIQEMKTIIDDQAARIATLEAK